MIHQLKYVQLEKLKNVCKYKLERKGINGKKDTVFFLFNLENIGLTVKKVFIVISC